jgi:subtilisin family serine protease
MSTFRRLQLISAFSAQPPDLTTGVSLGAGRRPDHLDLIAIAPLMGRTEGGPDVIIGLIDGPVLFDHPDLAREDIREISATGGACKSASSSACQHGTFVAGILSAKRGASAPAICPGCTLLVRPIFGENPSGRELMPSAAPEALAVAILDCLAAGARLINLSLGLAQPSGKEERALEQALDQAMKRGAIVVAAAGNQGMLGGSAVTRHPWVIPVIAFDLSGRPTSDSNLGGSIGRRGLGAPGDRVTSLGSEGRPLTLGGTSAATPFVTGAIALLWSEFPAASAAQIKLAVGRTAGVGRASVIPPLMNAEAAFRILSASIGGA